MSEAPSVPADSSLYLVIAEVRQLCQSLAQTHAELNQQAGISASMRAVMESLFPGNALTVPDIARARNVTRQHIQTIVNELLQRELVQTETNPAHKRSSLVRLTPLGQLSFKVVLSREQKLLQALTGELDESRLVQTAETLHELRALLNSGNGQETVTT